MVEKLVVVAEVPVAVLKVNFWRVVLPMTRRSPEVLMVEVAEPPILKELPVKLPEKREVEVAEVVVELAASKEPVLSTRKSSEPAELVKERNLPVKEGVEEALIKVPVVPVAFT